MPGFVVGPVCFCCVSLLLHFFRSCCGLAAPVLLGRESTLTRAGAGGLCLAPCSVDPLGGDSLRVDGLQRPDRFLVSMAFHARARLASRNRWGEVGTVVLKLSVSACPARIWKPPRSKDQRLGLSRFHVLKTSTAGIASSLRDMLDISLQKMVRLGRAIFKKICF